MHIIQLDNETTSQTAYNVGHEEVGSCPEVLTNSGYEHDMDIIVNGQYKVLTICQSSFTCESLFSATAFLRRGNETAWNISQSAGFKIYIKQFERRY